MAKTEGLYFECLLSTILYTMNMGHSEGAKGC